MRVKRSRFQGFKASYFTQLTAGSGGGGGVIFVSGAFRRTFVNGIHRASLCVFAFSLRISHRGGSKPGGKSTFNVKNRN